ncbi:MAG: hypothetical protein C4522_17970 [Desulfobacteraceae bacterium]|nr:MAG: hypothetical protein C4522_17970 [Desulfobacteraceae bacterium]
MVPFMQAVCPCPHDFCDSIDIKLLKTLQGLIYETMPNLTGKYPHRHVSAHLVIQNCINEQQKTRNTDDGFFPLHQF